MDLVRNRNASRRIGPVVAAGRIDPGLMGTPAETTCSGMSEHPYAGLTQLGCPTVQPVSPEAAVLERVPNPDPAANYVVRFSCPEFTSLCAVTGQPDFAHMVIDMVPDGWIVESKSLKLFLASFRNHSGFHEGCTMQIARRLVQVISPRWLRIGAYWYPRGGIPIDVFWQTGEPPAGAWIPPQEVAAYRGRG